MLFDICSSVRADVACYKPYMLLHMLGKWYSKQNFSFIATEEENANCCQKEKKQKKFYVQTGINVQWEARTSFKASWDTMQLED